jgi:isopenicillin N synthase-like dioxygenase
MTRWTGGRFVAPVHRVINSQQQQQQQPDPSPSPTGEASAAMERLAAAAFSRRSMGPARQCAAFFMHANHDAVVYDVTAAHLQLHGVRTPPPTAHALRSCSHVLRDVVVVARVSRLASCVALP